MLRGSSATLVFVILASCAAPPEAKGQAPSPPGKLLAECAAPRIRLRISLSLAHAKAWPHSKVGFFAGRELYVATSHVIDQGDLATVRLEARNNQRMIVMRFSPEGARKLADATAANVGEWLVACGIGCGSHEGRV